MKKGNRTVDQILPEYLKEKKIVLKPASYRAHVGKTKMLSEWLSNNGYSDRPIRKIKNKHIHEFFMYLADVRDLDKATCERYRDTLRIFFKYAKSIKELDKLPFKRVVLPIKKRDCKPKYIPKEYIVELLNTIRENDFQLFIASMIEYCSAVRPGDEMLNLKIKDIDFNNMTIKVGQLKAKTGKQRFADLTKELAVYLIEYGIKNADQEDYLFAQKHTYGKIKITKNNFPYRFNKYRDKLGIDKGVKFYSLKHTGATDLINTKLSSLPQLMKHLGHTKISSTEHYVLEHGGVTNDIIKDRFVSPLVDTI